MDKHYLLNVIDRLKTEIKVHDKKFQNNSVHNNCLPRMEKTLSSLQEELVKVEGGEIQHEKPPMLK
jgi:hypothetical protein